MSIRILIADDHAMVRQGLAALLQNDPAIVIAGEAATGEAAVHLALELTPDILLLDLMLPDVSGVDVIRQLKSRAGACKILVLSSTLEENLVHTALAAGADGYVLKASRMTELHDAVHKVAAGEAAFDPLVIRQVVAQSRRPDRLDTLTTRERTVFDCLARGYNYVEIAEQLGVSEATVRTHGASVLDKLDLRDRAQVMIYALKHQLVRREDLP